MAIESTVLYREVLAICASGPKPVHYKWRAEIVANKQVVNALTVASVHRTRDYLKNYADDVQIQLLFGAGTFVYDIYPYRRDLKIRVYGIPQYERTDGDDNRRKMIVYEGKAVIFDVTDPSVDLSQNTGMSKKAMDLSSVNLYTFQLIDPVIEELRTTAVGGIFYKQSPGDLLNALMTAYSKKLKFPEDQRPLGVTMVEANNKTPRTVIPIPHQQFLLDQPDGSYGLAKFLQFKEGGIYNGGIGCYYQDRSWYIYPPFDVSLYSKAKRKLTIVNIPEKDMRGLERSYKVEGNNVFVLACGETRYADESEHNQLNQGNGVRFSSAEKVLNSFMTGSGNKAKINRAENFSEFVGDQNPEKITYAPISSQSITSNPFAQLTPLMFKRGSFITLTWESGNIDVVSPGMPARVLIPRNGITEVLEGVVVAAESVSAPTGRIGGNDGWIMNAALTLFVTRSKIDTPKDT